MNKYYIKNISLLLYLYYYLSYIKIISLLEVKEAVTILLTFIHYSQTKIFPSCHTNPLYEPMLYGDLL